MTRPRPRLSLRWRLALLYGALLAVVAAVLLALSLWLVDRVVAAAAGAPAGSLVRVRTAGGDQIVVSADELMDTLRSQASEAVLRVGGPLFALVVLAGGALGYAVAARALQPVARITGAARRLSAEALSAEMLSERIALTGPHDELFELASTFDAMLVRLDQAFDSQRRFVANASHELRTPLAVMRTEVDVTLADPDSDRAELRAMGERVRAATERADALVESLLVLARTEAQVRSGLELREPFDLAQAVAQALAALATEVQAAGLRVELELQPALAAGDPGLLDRMVGNLVENAVRHNLDGGWLRVRTGGGGGSCWLCTDNTGVPVDPGTAGELLDPFRRGGAARSGRRGAGLGLSIVSAVVAAHDGSVRVGPRPGGGLCVEVRLPADALASAEVAGNAADALASAEAASRTDQ